MLEVLKIHPRMLILERRPEACRRSSLLFLFLKIAVSYFVRLEAKGEKGETEFYSGVFKYREMRTMF